MSKIPKQKVGLVILTGDEKSRRSLRAWLKREAASLHYKVKTIEFGNPEATIMLFKSKFGEDVVRDTTLENLHWLCGERTLGSPESYQSPYNTDMPRNIFIGMLLKLWTPANDAELKIAMQILDLEKEASAM